MNNALEVTENLDSTRSTIIVENKDSDINRFYRMDAPFQLTLEYCSGSDFDSYVNSITLSPEKSVLYQQTLLSKNNYYDLHIPHYHDYYEFLYVLDGTVTIQIEGNDYAYHAGSCYLINRGLYHLERYTDNVQILYLGLSPEFAMSLFQEASNSLFQCEKDIYETQLYQFISNDIKKPGIKSYLDFMPARQNKNAYTFMHNLAEEMMHTLLYPGFGSSNCIRGQIGAFLSYLVSTQNFYCTSVSLNTGSDFLLFARITRVFEENDGRISRGELEEMFHYSGTHLNRIVNKYTGMCLYDYGISFCLKKAANRLKESNDSIQSIAADLQFSNRTHFYQLFKNKYGVTPKEYRKLFASE